MIGPSVRFIMTSCRPDFLPLKGGDPRGRTSWPRPRGLGEKHHQLQDGAGNGEANATVLDIDAREARKVSWWYEPRLDVAAT